MARPGILDLIPSGVSIVSSRVGEKMNGMAAAWVSQVSYAPSLVMVSMTEKRYTYPLIMESKLFAISIMGKDQQEIARYFGSVSGKEEDKFARTKYILTPKGLPVIKDSVGYLECVLINTYPAGDHQLLIGEVKEVKRLRSIEPLIFRSADYW